ncbi:2-amino-4-hydroxy-6-hydroxymethyldihydropteridine diphosphokinase [Parahaliea maris]|uniref:2-amino-4-hydroxy-6-hydroxymethyldihydropteridine diphosphokinase n=1 Tax=Parahaliea maris TaxID=2716870 RepID=A0A5C8ZWF1_9GAMM|nr:2-amino-4-hydroxy-6-hydroxymethyldihydropteridine diphosphokinase [Parahaliea maris]TXS91890.1 2-amino-4-hydroxy-6-hydroxymethyldihydropteridine diphosphokinase [Parahaliea maris]
MTSHAAKVLSKTSPDSSPVQVYLGLGSNIEPTESLFLGINRLKEAFGQLECSSIYKSNSVGFDGDPFLNLVARIETQLPLADLYRSLRLIEFSLGRPFPASPNSSRRFDADILLYGNTIGTFDTVILPRPEILYNAHVLAPLAELLPGGKHPRTKKTYKELWDSFELGNQRIALFDG